VGGAVAGSIFDGGAGTADALVMTLLGDYDFTGTTIVDVEQVGFAQTTTATFNDNQIGASGIKQVFGTKSEQNALIVEGSDTDLSDVSFFTWGRSDQTVSIEGEIFVANNLVGSSQDDTISGGSFNDTLEGGGGTDLLFGNDGADKFVYRSGSDLVKGEAEAVIGAAGTDTVQLVNTGSIDFFDTVFNSIERLTYQSGTSSARFGSEAIIGFDKVTGGGSVDTLTIDRTGGGLFDLSKLAFSNWANGTDIIKVNGTNAGEIIIGTVENDTIDGKGGNDTMAGGGGDDVFRVGQAGDVIDEVAGKGTDRVITTVSYALNGGASVELLTTNSSGAVTAIDLTGNTLAQEIAGNAGINTLHDGGIGGSDTLRGFGGNDTYRVFNAGDTIIESSTQGTEDRVMAAVDYTLGKGVFIELFTTNGSTGTSAIDLTGNEIAQEIFGNDGDNRLEGKGGSDTLRGFDGKDSFVFASTIGAAKVDTIVDFVVVDDRFLLSDAIFTALDTGTLSAAAFRSNATGLAEDASDRIIYETDTGEVYYDADGTGGGAAGILFAIIDTGLALTNADFSVA
jgi:Ca2+-binding RTX toxin-like protein